MSNLIFYDNFQSAPNLFNVDGGPWAVEESSTDVICFDETGSWCRCMTCQVPSTISVGGSYTISIRANIVLDPSRYGNVTSLDFIWQYLPWWGTSSNGALSTVRLWSSQVGNNTYEDTLKAGSWSENTWIGTPFLHTGSIPLPASSSDSIPLSINISFPRQFSDKIGLWIKDVGFLITTPTVSLHTSDTAINTIQDTSGSSTSLGPPGESNPIGSTTKPTNKTGAIVGGVVGAVLLILICIFIGFLIGRKKKRNRGQTPVVALPGSGRNTGYVPPPMPDVKPVYQPRSK